MAAPFPVLPGEVAPVGAGESAGEEATMVPGGEGILGCGSVTPEAWKTEVISKQCPPPGLGRRRESSGGGTLDSCLRFRCLRCSLSEKVRLAMQPQGRERTGPHLKNYFNVARSL